MTHVHFIGIGGSGLSAIARLLLESGYTVSGSDMALSPFALELQKDGATVMTNHQAENIHGADFIVRSSAVADDNPEVVAARAANIPVYKRADFLGQLMDEKIGIAVAGTHGKTTTTAMLAWTLSSLKADPSFIVGGVINNLGVNARAGKGPHFVIEADEYDRMFLGLKPKVEIITFVEHDHPDIFPTAEDFNNAFMDFAKLLPNDGPLVACADEPGALKIARAAEKLGKKISLYGITELQGIQVSAQNVQPNTTGGFNFTASVNGKTQMVAMQVPGLHNVCNALAVLAVIDFLGLSLADAAKALADFRGAGRRFDVRGEANGIVFVDDYGHHPTEIKATLAGARARYAGRRIWAVWQPHTYSRTQMLFNEFVNAFDNADEVIVTEIYRSREVLQDYSSKKIVDSMKHNSAHFIAELNDVRNYLLSHLHPNDVLIVMSAGDADQVTAQVFESFSTMKVSLTGG